jgi:16S rRNA (cytosine1402-N4)-methyltransferase
VIEFQFLIKLNRIKEMKDMYPDRLFPVFPFLQAIYLYRTSYGCNKCMDFLSKIVSPVRHFCLFMDKSVHIPILVDAILGAFKKSASHVFLDGTLGGCGHAMAILQTFPQAQLWAMDRDLNAIKRAYHLMGNDRVHIVHGNFSQLDSLEQKKFDGILLDLGMSSDQLDCAGRGFSFRRDGPLDMRMNQTAGQTAAEFLQKASREELICAIRDYGEEPSWRRMVRAIIEARERNDGTLQRTLPFAQMIYGLSGGRNDHDRMDVMTRVFQGIRIAINGELDALHCALEKIMDALNDCGVVAILTFHSLEDRMVKRYFRQWAGLARHRGEWHHHPQFPILGKILTPKPVIPGEEELQRNRRSRSAKLRVFQKMRLEKSQNLD